VSVNAGNGTAWMTTAWFIRRSPQKSPKSVALNAYRKKLGPEALNDFRGFSKQCDKVRNILVLIHKIPGE